MVLPPEDQIYTFKTSPCFHTKSPQSWAKHCSRVNESIFRLFSDDGPVRLVCNVSNLARQSIFCFQVLIMGNKNRQRSHNKGGSSGKKTETGSNRSSSEDDSSSYEIDGLAMFLFIAVPLIVSCFIGE